MRNLFVLAIVATAAFLSSCSGDEHHVEIHFHNPADGATIATADAAALEIEVHFESEEELHEVEVLLYPTDAANDVIIDFEEHAHETEYEFTQTVDLYAFDSGTSFTLEAITCEDHDCTESHSEKITFTLE